LTGYIYLALDISSSAKTSVRFIASCAIEGGPLSTGYHKSINGFFFAEFPASTPVVLLIGTGSSDPKISSKSILAGKGGNERPFDCGY
jgi:hypothetical protein